jgi:hypothetical protein
VRRLIAEESDPALANAGYSALDAEGLLTVADLVSAGTEELARGRLPALEAIVRALFRTGAPGGSPFLDELWDRHRFEVVGNVVGLLVVERIRRIGLTEPALREMLDLAKRHDDDFARITVKKRLIDSGRVELLPSLGREALSKNAACRCMVAVVLGVHGGRQDVPVLSSLKEDGDAGVREAAARSLEQIAARQASPESR